MHYDGNQETEKVIRLPDIKILPELMVMGCRDQAENSCICLGLTYLGAP